MRVGEALAIEVDDLDLSRDDEHVTELVNAGVSLETIRLGAGR